MKTIYKQFLFAGLLAFLCIPMRVSADDATRSGAVVTGKVTDENNVALPGVTILIKDTQTGTTTDLKGEYQITVPGAESVLQFSFVGYNTVDQTVGSRTVIDVTFKEKIAQVEEVVVVGYGTQKKVSVVGAVSSVSTRSLESVATPSLSNTLGGQLPGIISRQAIGEPGYDQASIYIRGLGTWVNRGPLVLVDGIERDMNTINTEEIESVSILKDASATAVYGVQGANGVILITTKSGRVGKPSITFRTEHAILSPLRLPEFISSAQMAELINEGRYNDDPVNYTPKYTADEIRKFRDGSDPYLYPNVDWMDEILRKNTYQTINNLNISGGSDMIRYFVNVGYTLQEGLYKEDNLNNYNTNAQINRYNFRSKVDVNLSKSFVVSLGLGGIIQKNNYPAKSSQDVFNSVLMTPPQVFPEFNPDGSLGGIMSFLGSNPWGMLTQSGYTIENRNTLQGTFSARWDLSRLVTKGLSISGKFAYDHYYLGKNIRSKDFEVKQYLGKDESGNDRYNLLREASTLGYKPESTATRAVYMEAAVNYERSFGDHSVKGMVLYNQRDYVDITSGSSKGNLPYRRMGLAARFSYDYDLRYFLEFNMGYNGSENFAKGKRFGFFPSLSLGWVISNEKFWNSEWFSNFKIRGSIGQVGNDQIGGERFLFLSAVNTKDPQTYLWGKNPATPGGLQEDRMGNADATWEVSTKGNIGLDLGFFNDALILQVDGFKEWRDGILMQRQVIPLITGFFPWTTPYGNVGKTENWGLDGMAEYKKQFASGFFLSLRGNFTFARNKITEYDEPDLKYSYQSVKGKPIDQPMGLIALGFFKDEADIANSTPQAFVSEVKPGDIKYLDYNKDGVVDDFDRVAIGYSRTPEVMYGFGGTAAFKGFDVSIYFTGAANVSTFLNSNDMWIFQNGEGSHSVRTEYFDHRWTPETTGTAKYPRPSGGTNPNNYQQSTMWMRNANFLRLKNAEIGYTFRQPQLRKAGIESIRVFVNGTNLATFDNLKIMDPEQTNSTTVYPLQRTINLGIQATF